MAKVFWIDYKQGGSASVIAKCYSCVTYLYKPKFLLKDICEICIYIYISI